MGNGPFALQKWEAAFENWRVFIEGFGTTIALSVISLIIALVLGLMFGIMGSTANKKAKVINRVYVEFIQNTPLVIQIFFLYHALPHVGITMPVFLVGILGIGVYHGAYMAEAIRAGISAVPKGQFEAAYSQGFTFWSSMRYVVLPQARRLSFPPMTNISVNLIKNTSVMAMVAGGDLMYRADSYASESLIYGPTYIIAGVLYLSLCYPLAKFATNMERKIGAINV